jgi:hypothetical protein
MRWLGEAMRCTGLAILSMSLGISCSNNGKPSIPRTNTEQPGMYGENRMPGEYIVSLDEGGNEALVRKLYEAYQVKNLEDLGRGRFLIKLENDPGPEVIERKGMESAHIKSVQPNYLYR